MNDLYLKSVQEFHCALYKRNDLHTLAEKGVVLSRVRLMMEELGELACAMHEENIVLTADALADLLYVVFGTAAVFGVPITECYAEVHRSNMTKDFPLGVNSTQKGARKGKNFSAPELQPILKQAGLLPTE